MSMTKKHFEAIADALFNARRFTTPTQGPVEHAAIRQWTACVDHITGVCRRQNERFNAVTFQNRCKFGPQAPKGVAPTPAPKPSTIKPKWRKASCPT